MKQFDQIHAEAFPFLSKSPEVGFPDIGNGYYSKRLSYPEWFKMCNGQRCQINFLEQMTFVILASVIVSLSYPLESTVIVIAYFVGRLLFTIGYVK